MPITQIGKRKMTTCLDLVERIQRLDNKTVKQIMEDLAKFDSSYNPCASGKLAILKADEMLDSTETLDFYEGAIAATNAFGSLLASLVGAKDVPFGMVREELLLTQSALIYALFRRVTQLSEERDLGQMWREDLKLKPFSQEGWDKETIERNVENGCCEGKHERQADTPKEGGRSSISGSLDEAMRQRRNRKTQ